MVDREKLFNDILDFFGFTLLLQNKNNNPLFMKDNDIFYPAFTKFDTKTISYFYYANRMFLYDNIFVLDMILNDISYFEINGDDKSKSINNPFLNMSYEEARIFLDLNK